MQCAETKMSAYDGKEEEGDYNSLSARDISTAVPETAWVGPGDFCTSCREQLQFHKSTTGNTKTCRGCHSKSSQKTVVQQPAASGSNAGRPQGHCTDGREAGLLHEKNHPNTSASPMHLDQLRDKLPLQSSTASGPTGDPVTGFQTHTQTTGEYVKNQPTEGAEFEGISAVHESGGEMQTSNKRCKIVVYGRSQRGKTTGDYSMYFLMENTFQKAFPLIQRNEEVCYQGVPIPLIESTKRPTHQYCLLVTELDKELVIRVWLLYKEKFVITSASQFTIPLEQIAKESMDRLSPTSIPFLVACTGLWNEWCEDTICVSLSTGTRTVQLTFSIWAYPLDNHWQMGKSPAMMPEEDIRAMQRCCVNLQKNLHQIPDVLQYLYQFDIFDKDEVAEIKCIPNRKQQAESILDKITTRGDVLGIFIDILSKTRNRAPAKILLDSRMQLC